MVMPMGTEAANICSIFLSDPSRRPLMQRRAATARPWNGSWLMLCLREWYFPEGVFASSAR